MPVDVIDDMSATLAKARVKKAVIIYLSQRARPSNFTELQMACQMNDPKETGFISREVFYKCLELAKMVVMPREFEELANELADE